jgi:hypothetical protein
MPRVEQQTDCLSTRCLTAFAEPLACRWKDESRRCLARHHIPACQTICRSLRTVCRPGGGNKGYLCASKLTVNLCQLLLSNMTALQ